MRSTRFIQLFLALMSLASTSCHPAKSEVVALKDTGVVASPPADANLVMSTHWADDVRMYHWAAARKSIEALAPEERQRGDARYALAVACDELQDGVCAANALDSLEVTLPLLTERITELRAHAHQRMGAHEAEAEAWLRVQTPEHLARAAIALSRANADSKASVLSERAIGSGRLPVDLEAHLRALRMHAHHDLSGDQDARWIFVNAPASPFNAEASKRLMASSRAPTQDEWILRAHALVQARSLDAAIVALDRAAIVNNRKNSPLTLCRERGRAFAATVGHEVDAVVQFERCAKLAAKDDGEDMYAGALALAATEREEEAALLYSHAVRRSPHAPWAPEALYRAGRVRLLFGPWQRTEKDFSDLVRNYPTSTETREADLGRGLAFLAGKQWRKARATFERLGSDNYMPALAMRANVLAADAAWEDGDHAGALALWRRVVADDGLSWAGLVAAARLRDHGDSAGGARAELKAIARPESLAALPPPVDLLHEAGLDDEADAALRPRESLVVASARGQETEVLCNAYGKLGRPTRALELSARVPAAMLKGWPRRENAWAWACTYPRAYPHLVEDIASRAKIPAAWMYAILRQEGVLRMRKKDPTRGLMGAESGGGRSPSTQLDEGAKLLAELLRTHKSVAEATTAFHSGTPAAHRWTDRSRVLGAHQEVEAIGDPDARSFVMGVLADMAVYSALAGNHWGLGGHASP